MLTHLFVRLAAGLICLLPGGEAAVGAERGAQTTPPKALDISALLRQPLSGGPVFAVEQLDERTGAGRAMLSSLVRERWAPEFPKWVLEDDRAKLAAAGHAASRDGNALVIDRRNGAPVRFVNWLRPASASADGDGSSYFYAGKLGGSEYHRVDAGYAHDSPGSYLVHPDGRELIYMHSGEDFISTSVKYERLLVMNNGLNPPFGFAVVSLEGRQAVELRCVANNGRQGAPDIIPYFAGWHGQGYTGFNLVLLVRQADVPGRYEAMPVRFSRKDGGWGAAVPEPSRFRASIDLACSQ